MTTPLDTLTLGELVAHCRVLRLQHEQKYGPDETVVVDEPRDGVPARGGTGKARRSTRVEIPTIPGFWESLAAERDASMATFEVVTDAPHDHYKRSVKWLSHPGNCKDGSCLRRKVKWMAAQPEETHAGRNGRRLAVIHGIAL